MPRTRHKFHIGWLWLVPLTLLFLFRWWGPGLPISPRGESVPQLSYLWMLRRLWASGDALRGWNPLILGGEPTATARVYHLHLTLAAISWLTSLAPEWVLKITHGLTAFLAALGAYMYARHLGRTSGAAVVAGLAFALFPARILLTAESLFVTCVWAGLPWVFWAYERAQDHCSEHGASSLKHRMGSPAINWGLALTWIALTGPQWFLLLLSPLALYILLREGISWVQERLQAGSAAFAPHLRALGLDMLIAGSVVIGLSLFYYLPVLVEQDQLWSSHYVRVYPGVSRWSVSWPLLLRILLRRWAPTFQPYGWDLARVFPNIAWYLGLALCALALAGLTWRREWRRHVPLLGMLLASLLLVAGPTIPHNPAYAIVRRIPYISDSVRNAFRYLWPASFCLAALAAAGVDRLSSLIPGVMGHWAIPALAAVLIQADFWPLTQAYQTVDHYMSTNEIAAHRWLDAVEQPGRYWVPFQLARPGEHYADTSYGVRYNGRPSINDNEYHSPAAPDRATLLFRLGLRGQAERAEGFTPSAQAILDLSATRYVLLHLWPEQYEKTLERLLASGRYEALQQSQEVALLENRGARPYVQAYTRFLPFAPAPDEDLFALLPRALAQGYALVEWPGATPDQDVLRRAADLPSALPPAPQPNVEWRYSRPHADQIVIEYRADQPFLLMVSETWYPHWHVTVNGREHPLLLVNANFLGVWIQEPVGTISFHYRLPWYTWFGYIISAITAMTIVGLNVWPRLRRPVGG